MAYQIEVWCRECCGIDFMGCFDGGSEIVEFDTYEEAEEYLQNLRGPIEGRYISRLETLVKI